jgi:hypothetical protein
MKTFFGIIILALGLVFLGMWRESTLDPYEEGSHWSYNITCENGYVYKTLSHNRGTIQIFNSDGTPLKCGKKIH